MPSVTKATKLVVAQSYRNGHTTTATAQRIPTFTCRCCAALYMNQTARHLYTRVSDHLAISTLSDKKTCTLKICCIIPSLATLHILIIL